MSIRHIKPSSQIIDRNTCLVKQATEINISSQKKYKLRLKYSTSYSSRRNFDCNSNVLFLTSQIVKELLKTDNTHSGQVSREQYRCLTDRQISVAFLEGGWEIHSFRLMFPLLEFYPKETIGHTQRYTYRNICSSC